MSDTPRAFRLDTRPPEVELNLVERLLYAHGRRKVGYGALVGGIARAALSGRVTPYEYLFFELYDPSLDRAARESFVGYSFVRDVMEATGSAWTRFAEDKIGMAALLRGYDLPVPELQALVHPWRRAPGARRLDGAEEVARFLRTEARYPLFCKPVGSQLSLGTASIDRYEAEGDRLVFAGGAALGVEDFAAQILGLEGLDEAARAVLRPDAGYLFQSRLEAHPEVEALVGRPVITTVRVVLVVDGEGTHLVRAVWKLIGGRNVADNMWRKGNFVAEVDLETGAVRRAVRAAADHVQPLQAHPDTGASLEGRAVPDWEAVRALALDAAGAVPDCPIQGWDVGLTRSGPVLLELQAGGGSPLLAQIGARQGLLQGRYKAVVERILADKKRSRRAHRRQQRAEIARYAGQLGR